MIWPAAPVVRTRESWCDQGLLVAYRWNDAKAVAPLFPFGHGLSYTRFQYASPQPKLARATG